MQLMLNRQKERPPRYSQIVDLGARRNGGASAIPGGRLGDSNRGTRRFVSVAGLMQETTVSCRFLREGGGGVTIFLPKERS